MSDPYDSLEDECDKKNISSDSLNECDKYGSDSGTGVSRYKSSENIGPFYLNPNGENPDAIQNFQYELLRRNFLPKIVNGGKGRDAAPNVLVDNQILKEQGLQINNDGSFTKSPRPVADELPFITREYRNLQFQKKKTYKLAKTSPRVKIYKKNIFSFTENPVSGVSMNKIISSRRKKGSSEEILTSEDSLSSRLGNQDKELLEKDNLTDSMKERLILNQTATSSDTPKGIGGLRKTKRVMNLAEVRSGCQQSKHPGAKWQQTQRRTNAEQKEKAVSNRWKSGVSCLPKQQSDIVLSGMKPGLSYSERRQLQKGFNPLPLRLGGTKVLLDTTRSNFGDSIAERLSEISSRVLSCENLSDEDEELFYRGLMQKDKSQKVIQRSSRSEGPSEFPKLKSSVESGSCKKPREVRQHSLRFKPISKSMSIDLPSDTAGVIRSLKKCPHYCSADSSPNISKFELALKAKTYGYLANARNIFRMKAQCDGKLSAEEVEKNCKVVEKNSNPVKKASDSDRSNKNSGPKSVLPEIKEKLGRGLEKAGKGRNPPWRTKNCESSQDGLRGFALPRVALEDGRDVKIQAEILKRISSCLNTPNGRREDEVSSSK